jgi:hypothetical protein
VIRPKSELVKIVVHLLRLDVDVSKTDRLLEQLFWMILVPIRACPETEDDGLVALVLQDWSR